MKFTLFFALLTFLNAHPVNASDIFKISDDSICTTESCKKKYKKILKFASNGNPTAQLMISLAYFKGEGFEKNPEKGLKWLKKAKRQGSTKALWLLSRIYREGEIVKQDTLKADYLLNIAVKREYPPALFEKATQTLNFEKADNAQEVALLFKSKKLGYKPAKYLYAKMQNLGLGTKVNKYESAKAFRELGNYKESENIFSNILSTTNSGPSFKEARKLKSLEDIEVIEINYTGNGYESFIDSMILVFRDESSMYDGLGGFSHIKGRTCDLSNGCRFVAREELREVLK